MALGTSYTLEIHRGDDRQITGTVVDPAGAAVDVTGGALTYILVAQDAATSTPQPKKNATAIATKSVGSGIVLVDAVNGEIRIDLGSGDTVGQNAPATLYHELQITLGGFVTTIMFGNLKIRRDVVTPGP